MTPPLVLPLPPEIPADVLRPGFRCDQRWPLHWGHTARTVYRAVARGGPELVGYRCMDCGKESRTWTLVRGGTHA